MEKEVLGRQSAGRLRASLFTTSRPIVYYLPYSSKMNLHFRLEEGDRNIVNVLMARFFSEGKQTSGKHRNR